jgi:hypothetical protein
LDAVKALIEGHLNEDEKDTAYANLTEENAKVILLRTEDAARLRTLRSKLLTSGVYPLLASGVSFFHAPCLPLEVLSSPQIHIRLAGICLPICICACFQLTSLCTLLFSHLDDCATLRQPNLQALLPGLAPAPPVL